MILIIGINGVGKEHILACNTLGVKYVLFDVDITAFEGKEHVYNKWSIYSTKIPLTNMCMLISNWNNIPFDKITHAVIAAPDAWHQWYVDIIPEHVAILLEKPSACTSLERVNYVGYHKLYEPNLIRFCNFYVEDPGRLWSNSIADDLFGHLYYTHCAHGFVPIKRLLHSTETCFSARLANDVVLTCFRGTVPGGYLCNDSGRVTVDYESVFLEQMRAFLSGHSNVLLVNQIEKEIECVVSQDIL